MRGERRFAVVDVQGTQVLDAYDALEVVHGGCEGLGHAQVVPASESVAGVEADADAGFVVYQCDGVAEVFEGATEDVASRGHVFEERDDGRGFFVGAVDVGGEVGDGLDFVAVGRVCDARVEVVEFDAKFLTAFEVVDEDVVGLGGAGWVGVGEIDEVGAVRDDVLVLVVGVVFAVGVEAFGCVV
jgi:hypothetical protein